MKKLLLIVSILLVIVAIPVTIYLASQRQELRKKASPATTLALSPARTTKAVETEFSLEVQIDTGDNQVIASELHLTYDPAYLEAVTITNGALFPNVLTSGRVEEGQVSITVGAQSNAQPVTGRGTAAVVRFRTLAPTDPPTSIRFAETTLVNGLGEGATNVLTQTTPATVTISGDTQISQDQQDEEASESGSLTPPSEMPLDEMESTQSAEATLAGTLEILTPTIESATQSAQPTIRGKAPPGSKVTLTIYSDPITVVVETDANGNWVYIPQTPLAAGPHTIVATAEDGSDTATETFVVASGSGVPVSGSYELTIVIVSLALLLMGIGIAVPFVLRK